MKILVEFFPNPDSIALHVDKKVTDSMIVSFNAPDCDKSKQPVFVQKLFNDFKGIGSVTLEPYEIHMQKGSVFEWHELIPKIEEILRTDFSDDGEIERLFSVSNIASDAATEAELKRLIELIRNEYDFESNDETVFGEDVFAVFDEMEDFSSELSEDGEFTEEEED